MLEHVEAHSLGQGSALPDRHDVSLLHVLPARRAVHRHVLVALLEPFYARKTVNYVISAAEAKHETRLPSHSIQTEGEPVAEGYVHDALPSRFRRH